MAPGATRIEVCGRLRVEWEGEPLEPRGRQARVLFAYLVLHRNRPVRRDELVGAVWPGDAAAGVEVLLAPLLSRLRKLIGAERLTGRDELTLTLPDDAQVDWEVLQRDLERARREADGGDPAAGWEAASAAVTVADRGFLAGLEAPWVEELRADLADLRVEALVLAARHGAALGGALLAPAERAARAAVEAAPFRESARAALIEVLRAQGNPAEAVRAYEELRVLLREELGTPPGPELVALYEGLLADLDRPAAAPSPAPVPRSAPAPALPDLVERERELHELSALLAQAQAALGRVAVIEGPAGVGKTRLMAEARRRAANAGVLALGARAGELEREFPFGVVRQLFEGELVDPERRAALLAGAAAPAARVFGAEDQDAAGADSSFAVLHGLFWLVLNLANERPLVLAVDDLQWCDRPSLRFLAYVVRRLEGLPVLVCATLRTGEPATDPALLDELLHDPATVAVRPGHLSPAATRVVVRGRLGDAAADAFTAACHETTGGNPLLLGQLLTALAADGVRPEAGNAALVREIGPRAVSRTIGLRLARMPRGAVAVARAVAVLGEGAQLPTVAALAGLGLDEAATAVDALARAEILRRTPPLGFVHPLVRDAVYSELPPGERGLLHAQAARTLAEAAAPDDAVAMHLAIAPPRGDAWAAEVLERAAASAARRGAPESAIRLYARALDEPPPAAERPRLVWELGVVEKMLDGPSAAAHLAAAYDSIESPADRAAVAFDLGWTLFFTGEPGEAGAFLERALAEISPEHGDVRLGIEAIQILVWVTHGGAPPDFAERMAQLAADPPAGEGIGAKSLLAAVALARATTGGPAPEVAELALRADEGDAVARWDEGLIVVAIGVTLVLCDHPRLLSFWDKVVAEAHRRGSLTLSLATRMWRGYALLAVGDLADGEASVQQSFEEQLLVWGDRAVRAFPAGMLVGAAVAQGRTADARRMRSNPLPPIPEASDAAGFLHAAEAELLLAEGRPAEALALAERMQRATARHVHPGWAPWPGVRARALHALGRTEEALAAAHEELALARATTAPHSVGRALRILGEIESGEAGLARLREAVDVLEVSNGRLERARAHAALGRAQLDAGRAAEAREPLERALDLAARCSARPLVEACGAALREAGVAPRAAATGVAALTEVERRVAREAAGGSDVRSIAQRLFLTPREAEGHLQGAQRKLGAREPAELERALAAAV